jgi:hypothetical protein
MYSEKELEQQSLIDSDQWGRLESELGLEMLQEFAQEFFEETREIWFASGFDPSSMEDGSNPWRTAVLVQQAPSALKSSGLCFCVWSTTPLTRTPTVT